MTRVSATQLRTNVYKLLDEALETGEPIEIERRGAILRIVPEKKKAKRSKLDNLKPMNAMVLEPEEYVHMDWSEYWRP